MILYNTSFHIDNRIEYEFIEWLKNNYVSQSINFGFKKPLLTKVMTQIHPELSAYAFQAFADNIKFVEDWEEGPRQQLLFSISQRWGESCLAFSTSMEVIDL